MHSNWFILLQLIPAIILISLIVAWNRHASSKMLTRWANEQNYQLIRFELRYFRTGPYFWRHTRSQFICYVEVIADGRMRSGYVRLGGWFMGLITYKVHVTWCN